MKFCQGHEGAESVFKIYVLKIVLLCSFLCRSVVVDGQNRIAHFLLPPKAEILLQSPTRSALLVRDPYHDILTTGGPFALGCQIWVTKAG